MAMLIDLTQLRTFVAVAEEQHLTRAAERIHISQSAASAHVRAVEDTLNTQLFTRTNRSLELTRSGELLFVKAKSLLSEAAELSSFARELSGKLEGTLNISISSDPSSSRIGKTVSHLRNNHPLIKIDVRARPSPGIKQGIKNGELDVGIILDKPTDKSLLHYQLNTVNFCIAGPVAWKEKMDNSTIEELSKMPWITPASNSFAYSNILDDIFISKGHDLNTVAIFDNSTIAREMMEAGVGLTLVREEHALKAAQENKYAIYAACTMSYSNYAVHHSSRKNDPLVHAYLEALRLSWPELNIEPTAMV